MSRDDEVKSGKFYGRTWDGRLVEVADAGREPDHIICRRRADYPGQRAPVGARLAPCSKCGELVAYNPLGRFPDKPKVCMQCAHIRPLPIEVPH